MNAEPAWMGSLLTWAAGFIDAIGYLTLGEVYVANMSGNTIGLSIYASKQDWMHAWAHACPILAFVPGLIAGDAIVRACKLLKLRAPLTPALLLEAMALGCFLLAAHQWMTPGSELEHHGRVKAAMLVGLLSFSMGLQNGALRRIGGLKDVHTYVTGTLLATAHGCTDYLFWLARRWRHRPTSKLRHALRYSSRQQSLRGAAMALTLFILYGVGAVAGTLSRIHYGIDALLVPLVILVAVVIVLKVKPMRAPN